MVQPIFDGGMFCIMIIIGFASMAFAKKFGALMLVIPIVVFLICGLVVLTGDDVAFFTTTNPTNMTIVTTNGTFTTTTTYHNITPSNETTYLIGNGQFPITGTGQLILGYSLLLFSLMIGVVFLDQTLKGKIITFD